MSKDQLMTSCCAVFVAALVSPAAAQTASQPAAAETASQSAAVGEVIVTAQRRSERLQDVPITITNLSSKQLKDANIQDLGQIQKVTPALRFDNQGPFAQATIRGIGSAIVTSGSGSNVGIYIDGFYSPNPVGSDFQLLNVDNIQVLKGPQGTLFGRNTTGGAILVTTSKPSHTPSGMVDASYGSYNAQRYQAYFTTGLTDNVAVDLGGQFSKGDGFIRNIATGSDKDGRFQNWSWRAGVKVDLTKDISVLLRYQHQSTDDPYSQLNGAYVYHGQPLTVDAGVPGAIIATRPDEVSITDKVLATTNNNLYQMTTTADLSFATLTSYTQYKDEKSVFQQDFNVATPNLIEDNVPIRDQTFSQEFLLTSKPGGPLQWTTGAFFLDYRDRFEARLSIGGPPFFKVAGSYSDTRSTAFFVDATYQVLEKLYLTAGVRYSHDEMRDPFYEPGGGKPVYGSTLNGDPVTPRVVLRYAFDSQSSVYGSFTRGYKAGLYNLGGQDAVHKIRPESVNAFEVGYKHSERVFSLDASAFYYDYTDLQVASYSFVNGVPLGTIANAAKSTIKGVEGQAHYRPISDFEINVSAAYLDAKYDHFKNDPVITIGPNAGPIPDAKGYVMQRAPKFTASVGARYSHELAGGQMALSGNVYYTSKFFFDTAQQVSQDDYATLGLRAEWTDPSNRYTVAVYGDNVTNTHYLTQAVPETFSAPTSWSAPATVAGEIRVRFP